MEYPQLSDAALEVELGRWEDDGGACLACMPRVTYEPPNSIPLALPEVTQAVPAAITLSDDAQRQ